MFLRLRRRQKNMTYMMFDDHGNALGSWTRKKEAMSALDKIIKREPECADSIAIFAFDYYGHVEGMVYPGSE